MIKIFIFVIGIVFLACSCWNTQKTITIAIENNSDIKTNIEVSTYLDDSLIDKRLIKRDTFNVSFSIFKMTVQTGKKSSIVKFELSNSGQKAECRIKPDSINNNSVIHVNYIETLFKKGYQYKSKILNKDTVVREELYCEVMYEGF